MTFTSIASVAIVPPANLTGLVLVGLAWRRPTLPLGALDPQVRSFSPSASAWVTSYDALHEWIGLAWYSLRSELRHG